MSHPEQGTVKRRNEGKRKICDSNSGHHEITVFWYVTPCSFVDGTYVEEETSASIYIKPDVIRYRWSSISPLKVGTYPLICMALQTRIQYAS